MGICKSKILYSYDKKFIYNIKHSNGYLQIYLESKKLNIDIFIYLLYNSDFSINEAFAIYNPIIFNIGKIKYINKDHICFPLPNMYGNKLYYDNNLVFQKTLEYIEYYDIYYYDNNNLRTINKNIFYRINYICSKNLYVRMYLLKLYILKIQYKNYDVHPIIVIKYIRKNKMFKITYYCRI